MASNSDAIFLMSIGAIKVRLRNNQSYVIKEKYINKKHRFKRCFLFIYFSSVSHVNNYNSDVLILNICNNSIFSHSISPIVFQISV